MAHSPDYWKIFDQFIEELNAKSQIDIGIAFIDAKKCVNGLTDGWFDFKFAIERAIIKHKNTLTAEQTNNAKFLLEEVNKYLMNK